jgi:hypothetical protein
MNQLKGEATPEQIAEWKEKYGKVFKYEVDGKVCYLRSVDRNTYALAASKVQVSPAKFNEVVIEAIWLGGDTELKKLDCYYYGLIDFVEELMAKKKGTLSDC